MEQSNQSKKVLLSVIGIAILVVAVVGVSFAFFSYTRTGDPNTIQTGTIVFSNTSAEVGLTNAFPITTPTVANVHAAVPNQIGYGSVSITGNTTYADGIDFEVRVTDVDAQNASIVPRVAVTTNDVVEDNVTKVTMTKVYTNTAKSTLTDGTLLARGNIAANKTVSGAKVFEVAVWYDKDDYHISDQDNATLAAAGLLPSNYVSSGGTIVSQDAWNAMGSNAYSFTIRVSAVEGNSGRLSVS